jgi:hypothetical protein
MLLVLHPSQRKVQEDCAEFPSEKTKSAAGPALIDKAALQAERYLDSDHMYGSPASCSPSIMIVLVLVSLYHNQSVNSLRNVYISV